MSRLIPGRNGRSINPSPRQLKNSQSTKKRLKKLLMLSNSRISCFKILKIWKCGIVESHCPSGEPSSSSWTFSSPRRNLLWEEWLIKSKDGSNDSSLTYILMTIQFNLVHIKLLTLTPRHAFECIEICIILAIEYLYRRSLTINSAHLTYNNPVTGNAFRRLLRLFPTLTSAALSCPQSQNDSHRIVRLKIARPSVTLKIDWKQHPKTWAFKTKVQFIKC